MGSGLNLSLSVVNQVCIKENLEPLRFKKKIIRPPNYLKLLGRVKRFFLVPNSKCLQKFVAICTLLIYLITTDNFIFKQTFKKKKKPRILTTTCLNALYDWDVSATSRLVYTSQSYPELIDHSLSNEIRFVECLATFEIRLAHYFSPVLGSTRFPQSGNTKISC